MQLLIRTLLVVAVVLAYPTAQCFVSKSDVVTGRKRILPPRTTTTTASLAAPLFARAGDFAKGLGRWVGEAFTVDSVWKKIPQAIQDGLEEGQANARARNAKPMEALPSELGPVIYEDGDNNNNKMLSPNTSAKTEGSSEKDHG